jgi:hypothetical protein
MTGEWDASEEPSERMPRKQRRRGINTREIILILVIVNILTVVSSLIVFVVLAFKTFAVFVVVQEVFRSGRFWPRSQKVLIERKLVWSHRLKL